MKRQYCLNFWGKMTYMGIFGLEFSKIIVIFEISSLKFFKLQSCTKKWKYLNLEPKMPYLGIFQPEFWKSIVVFEISTLKFFKFHNFLKKMLRKLWNRNPKLFKKLLSYLKLAPSNLLNSKISPKNKIS